MNRSIAFPTTLRGMLLLALVAMTGQAALAAESPANKLQSVDVQPGGKGLQLVLTTSGPAPTPISFTIDNPARISLDLPATGLALAQRRIDVRSGGLDSVLAAESSDGRTRLVLNLEHMLPYQTRVDGNHIYVTLGEGAAGGAAVAAATPGAAPVATRSGRGIQSIDFRRSGDGSGTGRLIVKLNDPRTPVNLRQQGNQVLVDFVGADLPANLQRHFDVSDFATPVGSFDARRTSGGSQLVISASGDFEQLAYQSDDQYVVEIQPRRQQRMAAEEKPVYTGERMTANFQDIETRTLLQLIGDTSGRNIVIMDSVTGSVTLRLNNVPWDQVLDIVLRTKGLDKRVEDNVIIVGPTTELANQDKARLAATKDIQDLAPLRTEYLQINYAKAEDIAALIPGTERARQQRRSLVAVRTWPTQYRSTHQYTADPGYRRQHQHRPPAGVHSRRSGETGADRGTHRGRQRRLLARPGRAQRVHRDGEQRSRMDCSRLLVRRPEPIRSSGPH